MKLDILAFGAHPDDIELSCAGMLINEVKNGKKVGIIDLTQGELGSRGTVQTRYQEASRAHQIMGVHARENLMLQDGFFENSEDAQLKVIQMIRKYRPDVIVSNAIKDRHPDHGKGADLLRTSHFLTGLVKIKTELDGVPQEHWRPKLHYHYIQDQYIEPDFVVDISESWDLKLEAIRAYKTQFLASDTTDGPQTYISSPHFMQFIEARAKEFGHRIGTNYGEGFTVERMVGVSSVFDLV